MRTGDCRQGFEVAKMERKTDAKVRRLIAKCFEEVFSLLVSQQDALVALSAAILQILTIEKGQLQRIIKEAGVKQGKRWNL